MRSQDYANLHWENLIEEIEDMGRKERKSLKSNLIVILLHLLKWQYQPELRGGSWKGSIVEHRQGLRDALKESPSFKPYLTEIFDECYLDAVERACAETGIDRETFPESCPYTIIEVLAAGFFPANH